MFGKLRNVREMVSRHLTGAALFPRRGWDGRWHWPRSRFAGVREHHRATLIWAIRHPIQAWRLWSV